MLKEYSLPYYGLVDKEYTAGDAKITVLDEDMEAELRKMGWSSRSSKPIPHEAYQFIIDTLKTLKGRENVLKTKVWESINNMFENRWVFIDPRRDFPPVTSASQEAKTNYFNPTNKNPAYG